MHIASIGIDLGKTMFHLIALDDQGTIVINGVLENLGCEMVLGNRAIYQDQHARIIIVARRKISN